MAFVLLFMIFEAVLFNVNRAAKRAFFVFKTFESLKSLQDTASSHF